jgi:hypothetical protein
MKYKTLSLAIQKIWPMLKFLKSGSNFKVKVTKSNILVPREGLVIRNKYMKYESPITRHLKDTCMVNVIVFGKWVKLQGQGHKIKNFGTSRKSCHKVNVYEIPITCNSKRYHQC